MTARRTALLTVALLPMVALAEPTTRPARTRPVEQRTELAQGEQVAKPPEARRENWAEAYKFFKENSPRRAAAFERLPKEKQGEFATIILNRYSGIRILSRDNPRLHDLRAKQLHIEDEIFNLKSQLSEGSDDSESLKTQLHLKVEELVAVNLEERQLRIERLKTLLSTEERLLKADQGRQNQMVENRFNRILAAPGPEVLPPRAPMRRPRDASKDPRNK